LDGVFNHASRGFWQFHHILETGGNSPYLDWFVVKKWPLRPYSSSKRRPPNYQCWCKMPALPEFNTDNPGVREYIFGVAKYWLEFGIDGWRLDVPGDIDDDSFWQEFRQVVKDVNSDAYVCGEIWWNAQRWLQGDQFDAVMNYIFTSPVLSFFGGKTLRADYSHEHLTLTAIDAAGFATGLEEMYGLYDWEINYAQMNMLDSHDMARALYILGEDKSALKMSILAMMTLPGAPCIYYGDEIGLSAAGDPYCRAAFPWHNEDLWDRDLLTHYRDAIALRKGYPVLRTGTFQTIYAEGDVYACQRKLDGQGAIVIYNVASEAIPVEIPIFDHQAANYSQVWPHNVDVPLKLNGGKIQTTVPARDGLVLVNE